PDAPRALLAPGAGVPRLVRRPRRHRARQRAALRRGAAGARRPQGRPAEAGAGRDAARARRAGGRRRAPSQQSPDDRRRARAAPAARRGGRAAAAAARDHREGGQGRCGGGGAAAAVLARDVLGLTRGHWQDGARARGVSIEVENRLASATTVDGNAAALREAVTNLVLNAIDAMPKGGRLTLETRIDGDHAVLVVADTGIGMSESVRLKAHEPFFTTKGVKATGLGLSVAYGIVRSHGGELGLDSREGHGTTVTLTL